MVNKYHSAGQKMQGATKATGGKIRFQPVSDTTGYDTKYKSHGVKTGGYYTNKSIEENVKDHRAVSDGARGWGGVTVNKQDDAANSRVAKDKADKARIKKKSKFTNKDLK